MYTMSSITGTGSSVSALSSAQQTGTDVGSIVESDESSASVFTGTVPGALLGDFEKKRRGDVVNAIRKSTNLYRRISSVHYTRSGHSRNESRSSGSRCITCAVTLVRSCKDKRRSGVKLRCPCDVRVCATCIKTDPAWYLVTPHFDNCSTVQSFVCTRCFTFQGVKERVCCLWMCFGCAADSYDTGGACSKCSRPLRRSTRKGRRAHALWHGAAALVDCHEKDDEGVCDEDRAADYRDLLRAKVHAKVAASRHLTENDIAVLFGEHSPEPLRCTCAAEDDRNPMCPRCTPVMAVLKLLAANPKPLLASFAERAIPGRALARNVYDRELLTCMLNDRDLPLCSNGHSCKGKLLKPLSNPRPLNSLVTREFYEQILAGRVSDQGGSARLEASPCILCILFNQSAAVAQTFSPDRLNIEPYPTGPVYYFNVKLTRDVGIPEVRLDGQQGYVMHFQGTVGGYKPTFYYNWRDMLNVLRRDETGKIWFS